MPSAATKKKSAKSSKKPKYEMPPHVIEDFKRMLELAPDEPLPSALVLRYKRYEKVNAICSLPRIQPKELLLLALTGGFLNDVEPDEAIPGVPEVEVVEADVPPVDPDYEDEDGGEGEDESEEEDFSF